MSKFQQIPVSKLVLSSENPRYERQASSAAAIRKLVADQDEKLIRLAADIAAYGLDPSQNLLVTPLEDDEYLVLEGNRRLAALKLILSAETIKEANLSDKVTAALLEIHHNYKDSLPRELSCAVLSKDEAEHWILLRHTGENGGVGVVQWTALQIERYKGSSPLLQAMDAVTESQMLEAGALDSIEDFPITNFSRLINTKEVRLALGIDFSGEQLVFLADRKESIGRLALILKDILDQKINVNHIRSKEQRIQYANEVLSRPLPMKTVSTPPGGGAGNPKSRKKRTSLPATRSSLVPKNFSPTISLVRINKIFEELKSISLKNHVNSAAVILRVFLELSVDEFADKKKIVLRKPAKRGETKRVVPMTLSEKMLAVAKYLKANGTTDAELRGIVTLAGKKNHILSVDNLHAYVHNKHYSPTADDLKTIWDNIQLFVERISL